MCEQSDVLVVLCFAKTESAHGRNTALQQQNATLAEWLVRTYAVRVALQLCLCL